MEGFLPVSYKENLESSGEGECCGVQDKLLHTAWDSEHSYK